MSVTFVTALVLPKDGQPHRPIAEYLHWAHFLVDAQIPLIVFVDERLPVDIVPGVRSVPTSMTGKWIDTTELPKTRNIQKDTASYMSIQLQKLHWVVEASTFVTTPLLAWIDIGVFHMVRHPPAFQAKLRDLTLYAMSPSAKILAPGCWAPGSYPIWSSICWRFSGTFLLGPRDTFTRAAERQTEIVQAHLPRLTWEVNYWTLMEDLIEWYDGPHGDLLLNIHVQHTMHIQAKRFLAFCKTLFPSAFRNRRVLDVGAGDINGNNRWLFEACDYTGNDVADAPNVTIVSKTSALPFGPETFDTIVSSECFEHDPEWKESIRAICTMLKPGGMFCFTCASTGRNEHGTRRANPGDSYGVIGSVDGWMDHYKNLTIDDIRDAIDVDATFDIWDAYYSPENRDLYFYGIKRGGPPTATHLPLYTESQSVRTKG